jgi:hypothetical protein
VCNSMLPLERTLLMPLERPQWPHRLCMAAADDGSSSSRSSSSDFLVAQQKFFHSMACIMLSTHSG